jgi:spoIIIJ-associated protein
MPKKKSVDSKEEIVKQLAEELLAGLQIPATVTVSPGEEDTLSVNITTEESGLLIGYHGETLSSFQLILGLMVYKKLGQWVKVVLEIGDYRAKRAEQLTAMAQAYANQALSTGQPVYLPPLPPSERRVVHLALQENPQVETESVGDGNSRRVVVKPKGAD